MVSSFLANNHSRHLHNTKYSSYIGVGDKGQQNKKKKPFDGIPEVVLNGLVDYRASPLMANSLKGLPKTLIITCEFDILKDDGLLYRARLLDAGVSDPFKLHELPSFFGSSSVTLFCNRGV